MNKHLSRQELKDVEAKHPVHNLMSRADKLDRLASIVAKQPYVVMLFDRVEYMSKAAKEHTMVSGSIFDLAMQDPLFRAAGLQGSTIAHGQRFFEISDEELHDLSCNCGGQISQAEMAKRLLSMKNPSTRYLTPIAIFAVGAATWAITAAVAIQAFA